MDKVSVSDALARIDKYFDPKIIASVNGQHVKLAKVKGEFVWHQHELEDELFLVVKGCLTIQLRDRNVTLNEGEMFVVPRGVEHCPLANEEAHIMMFEPAGTLNTGNVVNELTVAAPEVFS